MPYTKADLLWGAEMQEYAMPRDAIHGVPSGCWEEADVRIKKVAKIVNIGHSDEAASSTELRDKWAALTSGKTSVKILKDGEVEKAAVVTEAEERHFDDDDSWDDLLPNFDKVDKKPPKKSSQTRRPRRTRGASQTERRNRDQDREPERKPKRSGLPRRRRITRVRTCFHPRAGPRL